MIVYVAILIVFLELPTSVAHSPNPWSVKKCESKQKSDVVGRSAQGWVLDGKWLSLKGHHAGRHLPLLTLVSMLRDAGNHHRRHPQRCPWPDHPSRKQELMCRAEPRLAETLEAARDLAKGSCREAFQFDLWNCSLTVGSSGVFSKAFRETALLQAVAGAALVHELGRACAQGRLRRCGCAQQGDADAVRRAIRVGGGDCGDDVVGATKVAVRFVQLGRREVGDHDDPRAALLRHNWAVGHKVVRKKMVEVCHCHGLSGSCSVQTCWKRFAPFSDTIDTLRDYYHAAKRLPEDNTVRRFRLPPKLHDHLLYMDPSPKLCSTGVGGRKCSSPENCATLCCGGGYNTVTKNTVRPCNCRWANCCSMRCGKCVEERKIFFCK